jgi:hypothetical protein
MARGERKTSGGNQGLLLVLLVLLVGLCAWNYQRNLAIEKANPSPYASLSDHDLDALIEAYRSEIDQMKGGRQASRARVRDTANVGSGVREFERVQRASRSVREAGYALSEREGAVEALEMERAKRVSLGGSELQVFLRRTFTF